MPLPAGVTTVPFHGQIASNTGTAGKGTISFYMPFPLRDTVNNGVVGNNQPLTVTLDANGEFTVSLPATDDADITPTGWAYTIHINTNVWQDRFQFQVPAATVGTLELADVVEVVVPPTAALYALKDHTHTPASIGALGATELGVMVGGVGDGAADDTTALQVALTAGAGGKVVGRPGRTYLISAPLVISSGTTLDMTGCTVRLKAGSNCNMLRNTSSAGPSRDNKIAVIGGTWDRGANGGVGNNLHSLFLRRIDTVCVENVTYLSTGGKYGIAIGDVTNGLVQKIQGNCSSDTVHVTGPATDVTIEKVYSTGGDDTVGITTTDYITYDDVHGSINGVTIRDVKASTPTRVILLAGSASGSDDGFTLENITVNGVLQTGTGHGVYLAAPNAGATSYADRITISRVKGTVRLLHAYQKRIVVNECQSAGTAALVDCLPEGAGTVQIDSLTVQNCAHTATTTDAPIVFAKARVTIKTLLVTGLDAYLAIGSRVVDVRGDASIGTVSLTGCRIEGATNSTGDAVYKMDTCTVGVVNVANCALVNSRGVLQNDGATAKTILNLANVTLTGCNRIAQGKSALEVNYANVTLTSHVNPPFYANSGGALTVRGSGWSGYAASAVVRQAAEALRVIAPDFPVDLSILAKANGDTAFNTNAALACGAGPVVSDGTTWKNTYSGLTY